MENLDIKITNKIKEKMSMNKVTTESLRLGILLAIVGGFLDAYTYVGRGGIFANAQTGNIVLVSIEISKGQWIQALLHMPPILAFIAGVVVAETIKKSPPRFFIRDSVRTILLLEIVVLFIIGFVPNTVPNSFVTVTISFVASVQVATFRKLHAYPYSTTMSTGNLYFASQAAYVAVVNKDKKSALKALEYFTIIFSFIVGAFLGGLTTSYMGVKAIWGAAIVLVLAVTLLSISEVKRSTTGSNALSD
ncbi:YoaK family protein [Clostridium tunisiense]|uniref:YoaK family protein n=1 Tax=Clostridium tunisiense TaxID=219748 RepID=UPI0002EB4E51|nr:YoaK family protein [Clostridium tunisiense]